MKRIILLFATILFTLLLCGCITSYQTSHQASYQEASGEENTTSSNSSSNSSSESSNSSSENNEKHQDNITLQISTDKEMYKSAQEMHITFLIQTNSNIENAFLECTGIINRFKYSEKLNVSKGKTNLSVVYVLPRCNVCGGIRPGKYNLNCTLYFETGKVQDKLTVDIKQ